LYYIQYKWVNARTEITAKPWGHILRFAFSVIVDRGSSLEKP